MGRRAEKFPFDPVDDSSFLVYGIKHRKFIFPREGIDAGYQPGNNGRLPKIPPVKNDSPGAYFLEMRDVLGTQIPALEPQENDLPDFLG
jgi:hypothetical protein